MPYSPPFHYIPPISKEQDSEENLGLHPLVPVEKFQTIQPLSVGTLTIYYLTIIKTKATVFLPSLKKFRPWLLCHPTFFRRTHYVSNKHFFVPSWCVCGVISLDIQTNYGWDLAFAATGQSQNILNDASLGVQVLYNPLYLNVGWASDLFLTGVSLSL